MNLLAPLLAAIGLHVAVKPPPLEDERMLWVIAQLENGKPYEPGGVYCITYPVWSQHCPKLAFQQSATPRAARLCATLHLHWLYAQIPAHKLALTAGNVYLAWRYGATGARAQRATVAANDLAGRAQALYDRGP